MSAHSLTNQRGPKMPEDRRKGPVRWQAVDFLRSLVCNAVPARCTSSASTVQEGLEAPSK